MSKAILAGLGGLVIGAAVGYVVADKRLQALYAEQLEKETADMRVFYTSVSKKQYPTPEDALEDLVPKDERIQTVEPDGDGRIAYHRVIKKAEYGAPAEEAEEKPIVTTNVFGAPHQPEERSPIFHVTEEEFLENVDDFIQQTVTWYQGDDTVCDEQDDIYEDPEKYLGKFFRQWFGREPDADPRVVHVRNTDLRIDYEIVMSEGSYANEVLGAGD